MGSVVAITNQKGGVGKTTTAVNLAASLAVAEQRVLLIDIDPQGNATSGVGHAPRAQQPGTYDVLVGRASMREAARADRPPLPQASCPPAPIWPPSRSSSSTSTTAPRASRAPSTRCATTTTSS